MGKTDSGLAVYPSPTRGNPGIRHKLSSPRIYGRLPPANDLPLLNDVCRSHPGTTLDAIPQHQANDRSQEPTLTLVGARPIDIASVTALLVTLVREAPARPLHRTITRPDKVLEGGKPGKFRS